MIKRTVLAGMFIYSFSVLKAQDITLKKIWEADQKLSVPESVLFDPNENVLYVSCVNGQAVNDNTKSYIAKVGLDGNIIVPSFIENLNSTKGMCIVGNSLYVTEMNQLVEISLPEGKITNRYPITGSVFLNDLVADSAGDYIYISDSGTDKLWIFDKNNKRASILVEGSIYKNANALRLEDGNLLIGTVNGQFVKLNLKSQRSQIVTTLESGIDGIIEMGNNSYILSETIGRIWSYSSTGEKTLLSDTVSDKINAADIEYNRATNTLFVPTLFHNTVQAYELQKLK